ncbi:hypothetical protein, partial [Tabrizicola sp.]|uniref:hypothetical protein n=1 Tax=Tabrizicola sp. TaxID=2005166 RepID=UPI003F3921D6
EPPPSVSRFSHGSPSSGTHIVFAMTKDKKHSKPTLTEAVPLPVRDVADFHLRWPEFRATALEIADLDTLSAAQKETLRWLVRLADRVGAGDLT